MLEHLAEITAIDPTAAGRAANEMLGDALGRIAHSPCPSRCQPLHRPPPALSLANSAMIRSMRSSRSGAAMAHHCDQLPSRSSAHSSPPACLAASSSSCFLPTLESAGLECRYLAQTTAMRSRRRCDDFGLRMTASMYASGVNPFISAWVATSCGRGGRGLRCRLAGGRGMVVPFFNRGKNLRVTKGAGIAGPARGFGDTPRSPDRNCCGSSRFLHSVDVMDEGAPALPPPAVTGDDRVSHYIRYVRARDVYNLVTRHCLSRTLSPLDGEVTEAALARATFPPPLVTAILEHARQRHRAPGLEVARLTPGPPGVNRSAVRVKASCPASSVQSSSHWPTVSCSRK